MSEKFMKHWESSGREPLLSRMKGRIHPGPPLKQRLSNTLYRLQIISHRLDGDVSRLEHRGRDFFDKCTEAQMAKDNERAAMYANECAEVRKIARVVIRSQMAIEQVMLRLETVRDFGDVAVQMAPVVSIVQAVKNQLTGVMPQVSYELGVLGETLNNFAIEAGETVGTSYDAVASGDEAQRVLREAGTMAEQRMHEKFPEPYVPSAEREYGEMKTS